MREQRCADCASFDWSTGLHPTLSGSGCAPTADRSKTPAAGLAHEGLTPQGPLQKDGFRTAFSAQSPCRKLAIQSVFRLPAWGRGMVCIGAGSRPLVMVVTGPF